MPAVIIKTNELWAWVQIAVWFLPSIGPPQAACRAKGGRWLLSLPGVAPLSLPPPTNVVLAPAGWGTDGDRRVVHAGHSGTWPGDAGLRELFNPSSGPGGAWGPPGDVTAEPPGAPFLTQ